MNRKLNKKTLAIVTLVLALALVGGFAYAAITGTLFFTGTGTLSGTGATDTVQLQFHSVKEHTDGADITGSYADARLEAVDGVPNQKMVIEANFGNFLVGGTPDYHPNLSIQYSIQNTGTKPIVLTGFNVETTSSDDNYYLSVENNIHNIFGRVIQPNEVVESYTRSGALNQESPFYVYLRPEGDKQVEPGEDVIFTFEGVLDYEEYTGN